MLTWASVPADLLRLFFSYLDTAELLRSACVCRNWSRVASSDEIWIGRLSLRFHVPLSVLEQEYRQIQGFGALNLKDVFIIARPPGKKKTYMGFLRLEWFAGCPFHPKRHTAVTIPNIALLIRCYRSYPHAFWSMSGVAPRDVATSSTRRYVPARVEHRFQRLGYAFDRLVRWTFRLTAVLPLLSSITAVYALTRSPSATSPWHWLRPGLLALTAIPVGALASFVDLHHVRFIGNFAPWVVLSFICWHAWPQLLFESLGYRILIALLASGVVGCYATMTAKKQEKEKQRGPVRRPPPLIDSAFVGSAAALATAAAIVAWRIVLPSCTLVIACGVFEDYINPLRSANFV